MQLDAATLQFKKIEDGVFGSLSRFGNVILISAVCAVLAMMMIPLPPVILDFLLAINVVGALTLLLVAISISDSMKIATFPTLLLVATLFRLGLNIASTRLILTQGYAGHIIQTFGQFATAGNLLVGVLMFLILTIIQFIVIAKGSERVAEVAARFTLDALPGKQMSIDADLRAGLISQEEAKSLREGLHRESKMYGAMDGAMKFVKGDAIAGIIITVVNIFGGLVAGVMQRGLSISEALNTYSILTIGDGLVSQLPALLPSITAGFVVTRVADEKGDKSLGAEIGRQILSQPRALLIAGGLAFFIGWIPGFPTALFTLIAAGLAGASIYITVTLKKKALAPQPMESYIVNAETSLSENFGQAVPLTLEVGPELYRVFREDPRWTNCLGNLYPKLKLHLTHQLGVVFPDLRLSVNEMLAQTFRYRIRIYEVPVDFGILNPKHCAYLGDPNRIDPAVIEPPSNTTETVHGTPVALWEVAKRNELAEKGIATFAPEEMVLRHLARVLKKHAGDFIGIQEVRNQLNLVEMHFPELVREVCPKMMSIQKLTEIIKRLVEESVPIKDFRLILQTLSCCQPETKDPVTLTEQVRIGLRRTITFMHARDGNQLPVLTLDPQIEDEIKGAIQKNGSECYLALSPDRIQAISGAFKQSLWQNHINPRQCVALTNLEIRRYVRKIVEDEMPDLSVLSFQELDPKVLIQQLGTVSLDASPETIAVNG
ncbi:MAG: type III secretion system export apparatus subunit SctV [Deltaproteobacteria bacterium]|nr:type III secretion system export apparatus subunit SctV [Deltaproteobacteria bacterium]